MQLPRGTFQYIKKDIMLGGIIEELQVMKFSGICSISSGSIQGSIVFKSGKRILAEFRNIAGDAAWDEFQKFVGEKVDASVSTLDDIQIELSLEFNKSCRVGKGGKPEQSPLSPAKTDLAFVRKSSSSSLGEVFAAQTKNLQKPRIHEKSVSRPSVITETLNNPDPSKAPGNKFPPIAEYNPTITISRKSLEQEPEEKEKHDAEAQHSADIESKNFESDIDAIETMDVDVITSKIRGECNTLIKQLRLEHLTENREGLE